MLCVCSSLCTEWSHLLVPNMNKVTRNQPACCKMTRNQPILLADFFGWFYINGDCGWLIFNHLTGYFCLWTYTLLTDIAIFPNLNPKKNAWNLLINKVQEKQPLSIPKLKTTLWNVWVQMSNDYLIKLSDSMSNILRKVIEAKWQMIYQWFYGYHEINNIICFI